MISITLPDGGKRMVVSGISGEEFARSISQSLAKEAVLMRLNGTLVDLRSMIEQDAQVEFITRDHPESLEVLRHDMAHLFAEAVKELYPETQITIGPSIENGFYYDVYREDSFTLEDLEKIESRMREIVDRDEKITREVWDRNDAIQFFKEMGEFYKAEIIQDLPENGQITLYRQGKFIDLCRGPHLPSTKKIGKAFKLMKLAGAYWRGDHNNVMLQRVYGTGWATEADLKAHLHQLEEAEKRDHRKIGREMDLFHMQEEAQGAVFWHPKGWTLYRLLQDYIRAKIQRNGYKEVNTPGLVSRKLWEASGHWEKFRENMFTSQTHDGHDLALKPMNCPCHIQIFRQGLKSYRDLPYRMAEFGSCTRNEASGALHGIMRVRAFVQDDAHIFCTEDQIISESKAFCDLLLEVYRELGFENVHVRFSDRPALRAGSDATWDKAEDALRNALESQGLPYTMNPGEGAFYGPKLEFILKDAIGREWQCGTLQLDFVLPERLEASYIGEDGQKHIPVMLHRAILGTFERFIGILIEHYAGKFPLWLAPTQVVVATITNAFDNYGQKLVTDLEQAGIRVESDFRNEKISYKVREHSLAKVPYILTVGEKEATAGTVAIRHLGSNDQEVLAYQQAIDKIVAESIWPIHSKA